MPVRPEDLEEMPANLDEIVQLWVKNIDYFLINHSNKLIIKRWEYGLRYGFHLTQVRKHSSDKLPNTSVAIRERLEEIYKSAGWNDAIFNPGGVVRLFSKSKSE